MSKTVIISGGMLDEGFAEKVLEANPEAYIIAVDKGLEYLYKHKIEPQYSWACNRWAVRWPQQVCTQRLALPFMLNQYTPFSFCAC